MREDVRKIRKSWERKIRIRKGENKIDGRRGIEKRMKRKIRKMRREEMEGRDKTNTNRRQDEERIRKTRMKMEERKQGERYEQRRG